MNCGTRRRQTHWAIVDVCVSRANVQLKFTVSFTFDWVKSRRRFRESLYQRSVIACRRFGYKFIKCRVATPTEFCRVRCHRNRQNDVRTADSAVGLSFSIIVRVSTQSSMTTDVASRVQDYRRFFEEVSDDPIEETFRLHNSWTFSDNCYHLLWVYDELETLTDNEEQWGHSNWKTWQPRI